MVRWVVLVLLAATAARADDIGEARLERFNRTYDVHHDLTYVETTDVDYTLVSPRSCAITTAARVRTHLPRRRST